MLGIASAIWAGLFEVEPGSRTGIHRGEHETIAYVLPGMCEIRWRVRGESVGRKGIGALGIGAATPSIANALYNACGARIRHYPITPDKLLSKLPVPA
jgi:uncharacterized RmlC-like cupin family protein